MKGKSCINTWSPFLAHALGTLVGAAIAGLIAANYKMIFSLGIGVLFLLVGIIINFMLPGQHGFQPQILFLHTFPWPGLAEE